MKLLKTAIALLGLITFANARSNNNPKQTSEMKNNNQVIEITYFKPKASVSQEVFGKRNIRVGTEYAAKQPGFISRETGVDKDGTWVIVVHWENLESSQASMKKFGTDPSVADFNEMIDPTSFKMSIFNSKAFIGGKN